MSNEFVQCPECFGDGEDLEDSSKDCWRCRGAGEVVADEKPCPCCSAPVSAHNELLIQHETMIATLRTALAKAEADLARMRPVVEAAVKERAAADYYDETDDDAVEGESRRRWTLAQAELSEAVASHLTAARTEAVSDYLAGETKEAKR